MTKKDIEEEMKPFKKIKDPRDILRIEHKLEEIIIIALFAVIAGADTWDDIEDYGKDREEWLKTFLELTNGIPSHDTFNRVFSMINTEQFSKCFVEWTEEMRKEKYREVIGIDGKTIRRSRCKTTGVAALHVVSAWATENRLVLGQKLVEDKSNEITAIPELLDIINVKDSIVKLDAMGCQKEIAKKIKEKEADYLIALKGNQGNLLEEVKYYLEEEIKDKKSKGKIERYKTTEKNHGRIENRSYYITSDIEWLEKKSDWEGLKTIGMVISERTIGEETTKETRFYIGSIEKDVKEFARAVRGHWGIENSLHWCLDIGFREDESRARIDNAGINLAIVRHMAINLLKQEKTSKRGIKGKRLKAGWSSDYMEKIFFG